MPVVHGAARDRDCGHARVTGPDEPAATGGAPRRVAFIELADVARRRPIDLLDPTALAVIDEGGIDRGRAKRHHRTRHAIVDVKRGTGAIITERTRDARLVAIVIVAVRIRTGGLDGMGPDHPCAAGQIGKGARYEPRVRQDIADLVVGIGERVQRVDGTGEPIEGIIAEVLIAVERIGDQIHIAVGGKCIGEVLIEGVRSLLGFERTELEAIGRHTGGMGGIVLQELDHDGLRQVALRDISQSFIHAHADFLEQPLPSCVSDVACRLI